MFLHKDAYLPEAFKLFSAACSDPQVSITRAVVLFFLLSAEGLFIHPIAIGLKKQKGTAVRSTTESRPRGKYKVETRHEYYLVFTEGSANEDTDEHRFSCFSEAFRGTKIINLFERQRVPISFIVVDGISTPAL